MRSAQMNNLVKKGVPEVRANQVAFCEVLASIKEKDNQKPDRMMSFVAYLIERKIDNETGNK